MAVGRITQLAAGSTWREPRAVYDPVLRKSALGDSVEIYRVVDAVNSLPTEEIRVAMIAALKESAPHVRWVTLHDGRVSVA